MKTIYIYKRLAIASLTLLGGVLFTACGNDDASFKNSETSIPIDIACVTTPTSTDISNYITLNSGDVVVKESDAAEISIYHDSDGVKKVCLVTPSASILRQ